MAKFPITYSETVPSGQIAAVPVPMQVDTRGAQALAGGISELGQAFIKVQQANDAMELSTLQRKDEEAHLARFTALQGIDPTDDEAITKVNEAFNNAMQSNRSKRQTVNNALQMSRNETMPRWNAQFQGEVLQRKAKHAVDLGETEYHIRLGNGDVAGAAKINEMMYATDSISKPVYEYRMTNLFTDSALEMANVDIREGRINQAIENLTSLKDLNPDQLKIRDEHLRLAKQTQAGQDDVFGKQILKEMVDSNNLNPSDKSAKAADMKQRVLSPTNGLSLEQSRTLLDNIDKWGKGEDRTNNSLVYTELFRKVTQLKRGIGAASQMRQSILESYPNLDDQHFESINKYLDETVEGWNADILRRLEKEAIPHLAPRLSMLEKFMELAATPGISVQEKAKYDSLIEKLQEPAKVDADRLALYLDQARKWIGANPDATNFYENGRKMLGTFEKYTDEQINEMEKKLEENAAMTTATPTEKTWKYTAINKSTGERIGSDDLLTWTPIR